MTAEYLQSYDLRILDRNWRSRDDEIDIVPSSGTCWRSAR